MQELQQLWTDLFDKWTRISARDRWALGGLAFFLILIVLYIAIVRPINQYRQNATSRYTSNAELVTWIESNRARLSAPNTNDTQVSNRRGRSLVAIFNESSREYQLDISRVEPKAQNMVRLWLDAVKFNDLITWFGVLHEEYGIAIQDISIDQTDTAGVVRVNVTFRG
jgi:general secretion pathway protein M